MYRPRENQEIHERRRHEDGWQTYLQIFVLEVVPLFWNKNQIIIQSF